MKKFFCLFLITLNFFIISSCSNKELSDEDLYNQAMSYYSELKLDDAKQIFLDLRHYKDSSEYYRQIVNLQTIWHLNEILSVTIEDEQTIAYVKLDNGDIYLYYLSGDIIDKKLLVSKGE